jgi:signal peptidase I
MMLSQATSSAQAQPLRIPIEPRLGIRRGRRGRGMKIVPSILLAGAVLLVAVAATGMTLGAWRFTVIDTGSMRPTLNPGDIAILTSEPTTALRLGQIVAFHPPGEQHLTVMHRVVSIERGGGGGVLTIQTKGDANNAVDPWRARLVGSSVWHEDLKVPAAGYLAVWSQQPSIRFGLLSVVVILTLSILLGLIWESGEGSESRRP